MALKLNQPWWTCALTRPCDQPGGKMGFGFDMSFSANAEETHMVSPEMSHIDWLPQGNPRKGTPASTTQKRIDNG